MAETLPDTSHVTTFTASIAEQAVVSIPFQIIWDVTDITASTTSTGNAIGATSVVLCDGNALRIEIIAEGEDFCPPDGGSVSWKAVDVSWDAGTWTGGTGAAGTLTSEAYTRLADSNVNATELSSSSVTWTIAPKVVDRAGYHEISTIWKFSSFTP